MNRPDRVIEQIKLTVVVVAEPHDAVRGVGELAVTDDLSVLVAKAPDLAGVVVAVDVMSVEVLQSRAVIRQSVGDRRGLGVRHLDCRRQDGSRPARPLRVGRLPAFHHALAVVAATLDAIEHLPQFPADIANPQIAGLAIEAHPPRIAKTVRPDLAAAPFKSTSGLSAGMR